MRVLLVYPRFDRHASSHPELLGWVRCDEYLGSPSLAFACLGAVTPPGVELIYVDDRLRADDGPWPEADLVAMTVFTPAATRAFELADAFRARGIPVVLGGIFPSAMPIESAAHADAVVVGPGESVWAEVLKDAEAGRLRPRYYGEAGSLEGLPPPRLDLYLGVESDTFRPDDYPLQISRGCPLACDACVIPVVAGRKIRFLDDRQLLEHVDFFIDHDRLASFTEDTSVLFSLGARRRFRELLRVLRDYREGGFRSSYIGISLPMVQHLDDEFLDEMWAAGLRRFYLVTGFDPITRAAFGQNEPKAMARVEESLARCHDRGIEPYTSFLLGGDTDEESVFDTILELTERVKLKKAEFTIATPYPGTPAWKRVNEEDRVFDRTWGHYNDANVVFRPKNMTPERLLEGYLSMWREFYKSRQSLRDLPHEQRTIQF